MIGSLAALPRVTKLHTSSDGTHKTPQFWEREPTTQLTGKKQVSIYSAGDLCLGSDEEMDTQAGGSHT